MSQRPAGNAPTCVNVSLKPSIVRRQYFICLSSVTLCIVAKRCVLEPKLLLTACWKSLMRIWLVQKWVTFTFVYRLYQGHVNHSVTFVSETVRDSRGLDQRNTKSPIGNGLRAVVELRGCPRGPGSLKDRVAVAPSKHLVWEGTRGPLKGPSEITSQNRSNSIHDCNISISFLSTDNDAPTPATWSINHAQFLINDVA